MVAQLLGVPVALKKFPTDIPLACVTNAFTRGHLGASPRAAAQVSPAPKSLAGGLGRRHSIRLAAGEPSRRRSTRTVIARAS
jgi:hypothetical protein